jgi:hypothetical protein
MRDGRRMRARQGPGQPTNVSFAGFQVNMLSGKAIGSFISAHRRRPRAGYSNTSGRMRFRFQHVVSDHPGIVIQHFNQTRFAESKTVRSCISNGTLAKTPCN